MKKHRILSLLLSVVVGAGMSVPCAVSVPVIAASAPYVQSDTTMDFTRPQNLTYQVKFTVHGTHANPNIVAGNGAVLRTENVVKKVENGNDTYYFKVRAVGKVGSASAIYTTLPNQKAVRHFIMKVGVPTAASTPSSNKIAVSKNAGTVRAGSYATIGIKGKPNTTYNIDIYYDSGNSKAKRLDTKKSDVSGYVSWTWKVGTRTHAGSHRIVITGGGQTFNTSFTTTR